MVATAVDFGTPYGQETMTGNPLAYLPLNDATGSVTTADVSGNNNNGTISGSPTLQQPGPLDDSSSSSYYLNGSSYMSIPSITTNWSQTTVEAWVRLTSSPSDNPRLIANSHTDEDNKGLELIINSGATSGAFIVGNGTSYGSAGWNQTLAPNTWYFYVGTYDGSTAKAYINGNLVGQASFTGSIAGSSYPLTIGMDPAYNGDYLTGDLSNVAIFSQALSQSTIQQQYDVALAPQSGTVSASVYSVTDTQIVVSPPAGAGTVDVTVTTPQGTSATSGADHFTYTTAPIVTDVSPSAGPLAGGSTVTIGGENLTGATAVDFGTVSASVYSVTDTQIVVSSPPGTGTVDVTVTTPKGTSATGGADQFTYTPAPIVTGVWPPAGRLAGGTSVTIGGENFAGASAVDFGTVSASVYSVTDMQIVVTSPPGTGTVDVTVTTPKGTSATSSADQFTYTSAPIVTGIWLPGGPLAGGTTVTISGENFTGATAVDFGTVSASVYSVTDMQIVVTSPPGTGTVDVTVTTPKGTSATSSADQFTYVPPPQVSTSVLASDMVGTPYSQTLTATGGATPYTWSGSNLPSWLSVDPATGALTGTPQAAGTYDFSVTVTDAVYQTASQNLALFVLPAGISVSAATSATSLSVAPLSVGGSGSSTPDMSAATGAGTGTMTLADYDGDPVSLPAPGGVPGAYHDANLSPGSTFSSVTLDLCGASATSAAYWWSGSGWQTVSNETYDANSGCMAVTINATTTPDLTDLSGQYLALGNPNNFGSAEQLGTESWSSYVSDVNVASGNFTPTFTDLAVGGLGVSTEFARTYNSADSAPQTPGPFGPGWSFSYGMNVAAQTVDGAVYAMVTYGDGQEATYVQQGDGSFVAPPGDYDVLAGIPGGGFTLTQRDRTIYTFGTTGRLLSITDRNGHATTMTYNASGELTGITDAAGRNYTISWSSGGEITQIAEPLGVQLTYSYGANAIVLR